MSSLFSKFGVELELMIVDQLSLGAQPIADRILRDDTGATVNSLKHGPITWSNELVMHVLEFKTTEPVATLDGLAEQFHASILKANQHLAHHHACLLGSAMHPWFNPQTDTKLWLHDDREIYDAFNRIFDCRGHGWSNLQSFHLNLPFDPEDDNAFRRLHSAIRLVLPLIPALAASSPILDGKRSGLLDTRLETYWHNCDRIPSLTSGVIPDVYLTRAAYESGVFDLIARELAPHDPEGLLEPIWTNARGAIARFDRGSIEIRVGDVQECPRQDLAILQFIVHLVQTWCEEPEASLLDQENVSSDTLRDLLRATIEQGSKATVSDPTLLKVLKRKSASSVGDILRQHIPSKPTWGKQIEHILIHGNLAERVLKKIAQDDSRESLKQVYRRLADCLVTNTPFSAP